MSPTALFFSGAALLGHDAGSGQWEGVYPGYGDRVGREGYYTGYYPRTLPGPYLV